MPASAGVSQKTMASPSRTEQLISNLLKIGIALTSEHDLDVLLEQIVTEARRFTRSDAGSLYVVEDGLLRFVVSQNDTIMKRQAGAVQKNPYLNRTIPISHQSLAGYVASTGQILNIRDAYKIPASEPYHFNKEFDERYMYRTRSLMIVPLKDPQDTVIGVLQLINALDAHGKPVAFSGMVEELVLSLASQAAVALKNAQLTAQIKKAHFDSILRLSVAAEYRDRDTYYHIQRMSRYSALISKHMGWSKGEIDLLLYASPMHDVGKLGVPDSILMKPGPLTQDERKVMEGHTIIGADILGNPDSDLIRVAKSVALSHHEHYDGTGYPYGLRGDRIPLEGRVVSLADVFDALSSRRCYKPPMSLDHVIEWVRQERGKQFDPVCVDAFFEGVDEILEVYEKYKEPEPQPAAKEPQPAAPAG